MARAKEDINNRKRRSITQSMTLLHSAERSKNKLYELAPELEHTRLSRGRGWPFLTCQRKKLGRKFLTRPVAFGHNEACNARVAQHLAGRSPSIRDSLRGQFRWKSRSSAQYALSGRLSNTECEVRGHLRWETTLVPCLCLSYSHNLCVARCTAEVVAGVPLCKPQLLSNENHEPWHADLFWNTFSCKFSGVSEEKFRL